MMLDLNDEDMKLMIKYIVLDSNNDSRWRMNFDLHDLVIYEIQSKN